MIIAYTFIIVGVLFFLKNTGLVVWSWHVIWPLLLIGLGFYILDARRRSVTWFKRNWGKMFGDFE